MSRWRVEYFGFKLEGGIHTYRPAEDTLLLLDNVDRLLPGRLCIDIGTGSGVIALYIASRGVYTLAVDIDMEILTDARRNIEVNGYDGLIDLILYDGMPPIRCLDGIVIAMNPPYLPGSRLLEDDAAYIAGPYGTEVLEGVLDALRGCRGWRLLTIVSSLTRVSRLGGIMGYEKIDELDLGGEMLYVLMFSR